MRIAELKSEIRVLAGFAKNGEYHSIYRDSSSLRKATFDIQEARKTLVEYQKELSALQVAVDKTNLNSTITY